MRRRYLTLGLLAALLGVCPAVWADQLSQEINIYRNKAVEAQFTGNPDGALENYERALQIARGAYGNNSPFLAELYFDMGTVCLNSSKFNKAEDYLNQTVKLNPNSAAAHLSLAKLMRLKGRSDEAVRHAGVVVAKHRDDVIAREELALAYHGSDDSLREYRELSAMDTLVQHEREKYAGKESSGFVMPKISFAGPIKLAVPGAAVMAPPPKSEQAKPQILDAAKKAAPQKSEQEKKKAQQKADADKKKAQQKADQDKKKAVQKAEQDKKKAAELAKKKNKPAPANASPANLETAASEQLPSTGIPAKLRSKAVLLTPVGGKKKPAQAESTSSITVEKKPVPPKPVAKPAPKPAETEIEDPSIGGQDDAQAPTPTPPPPVKKAKPEGQKAEPMKMASPKPGKHAAGLVPPPPPVMTFPSMMAPPPPMPAQPKAKAAAAKKEEKPKEAPKEAPKEVETKGGGADEDDFLLDWGGANKPKGKKK